MKKLALLLVIALGCMAFTHQLLNLKLHVTVVDGQGEIVEGAKVVLYNTDGDHTKEANALQVGETNAKGVCVFKKLDVKKYYLFAQKGDLDNTLGDHETDTMHKGKINKITLTIE